MAPFSPPMCRPEAGKLVGGSGCPPEEQNMEQGRDAVIGQALRSAVEALRLVRRELAGGADDPARGRWVALGMVTALQGALVAALAGYETADLDAVRNPASPDRIAPAAFPLRRARGDRYLNPPERVELPASALHRIERVIELRNSAVHGLEFDMPASAGSDMREAADLIEYLVIRHPAFDPSGWPLEAALIGDELKAVRQLLGKAA